MVNFLTFIQFMAALYLAVIIDSIVFKHILKPDVDSIIKPAAHKTYSAELVRRCLRHLANESKWRAVLPLITCVICMVYIAFESRYVPASSMNPLADLGIFLFPVFCCCSFLFFITMILLLGSYKKSYAIIVTTIQLIVLVLSLFVAKSSIFRDAFYEFSLSNGYHVSTYRILCISLIIPFLRQMLVSWLVAIVFKRYLIGEFWIENRRYVKVTDIIKRASANDLKSLLKETNYYKSLYDHIKQYEKMAGNNTSAAKMAKRELYDIRDTCYCQNVKNIINNIPCFNRLSLAVIFDIINKIQWRNIFSPTFRMVNEEQISDEEMSVDSAVHDCYPPAKSNAVSDKIKSIIWRRAQVVDGFDSRFYRKDEHGAWIIWDKYNDINSMFGWTVCNEMHIPMEEGPVNSLIGRLSIQPLNCYNYAYYKNKDYNNSVFRNRVTAKTDINIIQKNGYNIYRTGGVRRLLLLFFKLFASQYTFNKRLHGK